MKRPSTFFRDSKGNIVIFQFPNWQIFTVFVLSLGQYFANSTYIFYSSWAIKLIMLYWSYLEIRSGVNGFRKVLGVIVGLYFLIGLIKLLT